ncbi:MAG: c-type cytochrome [Motiliproteus sp.]
MIKKVLLASVLFTSTLSLSGILPASETDPIAAGRQLFNSYCFLCHGADGSGNGRLANKLGITDVVADLTLSKYADVSTADLANRIAGYNRETASMMPKWKDALDDEQILQIATYAKTLSERKSYQDGKNVFYRACAVCHGADGKGGGAIAKQLGLQDRLPNLADEKYVQMSRADLVKAMIAYSDKDAQVPRWGAELDNETLQDVAAYIQLNPTGLRSVGNAKAGQLVFSRSCVACHGKEGKGDGVIAGMLGVKMVDYTSKNSSSITDTQLVHTISMGRGEFMPAWYGELSEHDIRDVAAYVRGLYKKN